MCERNINWLPPYALSDQGPNPQPRHVSWPGIEPVTFLFVRMMPNQLSLTGQGREPRLGEK